MRCQFKALTILAIFTLSLLGCRKWEDHTKIDNQDLSQDLWQAVSSNPALSKFSQYLESTGLDSILKSSKTYTVWAPDDAALATLDPAIVSDPVRLRSFLLNHISNQSYFTRDAQDTVRLGMLNGKYNNFLNNNFADATITTADKFVRNGVLHVINKGIVVLPSIWDFIKSTTGTYLQNAYINSLDFNAFDPDLAIIDSISSTTGLPIYRPGTGLVPRNRFNDRVFNLMDESKEYTYFIIANAGYTLESDSLKKYFKAPLTSTTDSLAAWNTVKDLVVEGIRQPADFAGLVSKYGVAIPANAASVIATHKLSNGVVYVLNLIDIPTANKFGTITVQGEFPSGFLIDRTANTNYRVRFNPVTNKDYVDIMVTGHGVTTFYSYYRLNEIPTIKYRVYAVAVNDFQTGALSQNVVVKSFVPPATYTTLATLAHAVPLHTVAGAYDEKLLGEFTPTNFGTLEIQLTGLTTGPIVLDYLRLVPVP
ncbi:MAG: fasciclin domain-containing protein [Chitinophagaceae bacterium]|nr:fasciclin domain-containing protein [Chitinophagaceae bacterium]